MISDGVYTYLKENSVDNVKEIIDSILALTGSDSKWSDYFDIYEDFDDYYATELYDSQRDWTDEYVPPTREELLNFIHTYNDEHFDVGDSIITWLVIEPLIDEADKASELLDKLNFLFNINYCNDF